MICKNEQRDIARALKSVLPIADQFVIVDTGSTDYTQTVVRGTVPNSKLHFETFTGASQQDETCDWKLWNFAAARNYAIEIAEQKGCTHMMWMDADDELLDPAPVARALYRDDVDGFNMFVEAGGIKWLHFRLWKTAKHVRFKGRIHEYPVIDGLRTEICYTTIHHHAEPSEHQEDGNARNLRILLREWEENPDARTAFYIACTHRDGGRPAQAAEWFLKRIGMGERFREEWLFSHLYLARVLRGMGNYAAARNVIAGARAMEPAWAEFIVEEANIAYAERDYPEAIRSARPAIDMPIIPSPLWREPYAYRDQGPRLISWCHEHAGQIPEAIAWAEIAADRIGKLDVEWNDRSHRLKAQLLASNDPAPAILITRRRRRVALVRPGAIGDILMTLNLVPAFKAANPDTDVHYFCAAQYAMPDALLPFMLAAGVDLVLDVAGLPARAKSYDQVINLVGYQIDWAKNARLPMDRHLLRHFAAEMGLTLGEELPTLELARPLPNPIDWNIGPYLTLQVRAGWSRYKQWSIERWQRVVELMPEINFVLIAEKGQPTVPNTTWSAIGASLAESIALVANARAHIGIDSFANHLTHYRWSAKRVPGVILFGSTGIEAMYPENINLVAGLRCQPCYRENPAISKMPLGPCVNPVRASYDDQTPWACMEAISVDEVVQAIRSVLQ